MAEETCPACGCTIIDGGHERNGVVYCCESCASGHPEDCQRGCCGCTTTEKS